MELLTALIGVYFVLVVIELGIALWTTIALSFVFSKAGIPGWKAWVPVVNNWTYFKLGGLPGGWALLIPIAVLVVFGISAIFSALASAALDRSFRTGDESAYTQALTLTSTGSVVTSLALLVIVVIVVVVTTIAAHGINRGFGLSGGYTALAFFFGPIWLSILAGGSTRWQGLPATPAPAPAAVAPEESVAQSLPEPFVISTAAAQSIQPVDRAPSLPAPPPPPQAFTERESGEVRPVAPAPIGPPPPAPPSKPGGANPWQAPISDVPGRFAPPPPPPETVPAPAPPDIAFAPAPAPAETLFAPPVPASTAQFAPPRETAAPARSTPELETYDDDENDRTVVVSKRRSTWEVLAADGTSVTLSKPVVVVGRRPVRDARYPDAQLVRLSDATKTVSKNHAVLRLVDDEWFITDLASTNGVVVVDGDAESVVSGGLEMRVTGRFILGDAEFDLRKGS